MGSSSGGAMADARSCSASFHSIFSLGTVRNSRNLKNSTFKLYLLCVSAALNRPL